MSHKEEDSEFQFFIGLLLAIRAQEVEEFNSEGALFQKAFEAAIDVAKLQGLKVKNLYWMVKDPVFNCYPSSEEMIIYGMQAMLISLESPGMTKTRFRLSISDAKKELLEDFSQAMIYLNAGHAFKEVLFTPKNT